LFYKNFERLPGCRACIILQLDVGGYLRHDPDPIFLRDFYFLLRVTQTARTNRLSSGGKKLELSECCQVARCIHI